MPFEKRAFEKKEYMERGILGVSCLLVYISIPNDKMRETHTGNSVKFCTCIKIQT